MVPSTSDALKALTPHYEPAHWQTNERTYHLKNDPSYTELYSSRFDLPLHYTADGKVAFEETEDFAAKSSSNFPAASAQANNVSANAQPVDTSAAKPPILVSPTSLA